MLLNRAFVGPHDRQRGNQDRREKALRLRSCLLINNRRIPVLWRIFVVAPNLIAADKTAADWPNPLFRAFSAATSYAKIDRAGAYFDISRQIANGEGLDGGAR